MIERAQAADSQDVPSAMLGFAINEQLHAPPKAKRDTNTSAQCDRIRDISGLRGWYNQREELELAAQIVRKLVRNA